MVSIQKMPAYSTMKFILLVIVVGQMGCVFGAVRIWVILSYQLGPSFFFRWLSHKWKPHLNWFETSVNPKTKQQMVGLFLCVNLFNYLIYCSTNRGHAQRRLEPKQKRHGKCVIHFVSN